MLLNISFEQLQNLEWQHIETHIDNVEFQLPERNDCEQYQETIRGHHFGFGYQRVQAKFNDDILICDLGFDFNADEGDTVQDLYNFRITADEEGILPKPSFSLAQEEDNSIIHVELEFTDREVNSWEIGKEIIIKSEIRKLLPKNEPLDTRKK